MYVGILKSREHIVFEFYTYELYIIMFILNIRLPEMCSLRNTVYKKL